MSHLDLSNLREITGGDSGIEKQLFQAFLESSEECLAALAGGWQSGKEEVWRKQSHALKGSALNLGAIPLGEICKEAQDSFEAPPEKKQALLASIQAEYAEVKEELKKLIAA
jgi:HPt (histidine-containing phosphotransfer) domain-containing protein